MRPKDDESLIAYGKMEAGEPLRDKAEGTSRAKHAESLEALRVSWPKARDL
jgi:hypothetical protein